MTPDLYEILEISPRASAAVIKAAYRCLAQMLHPDRNPGNIAAAARLVEINRAYAVLGDGERRAGYDLRAGIIRNDRRAGAPVARVAPRRSPDAGVRMFAFRPIE